MTSTAISLSVDWVPRINKFHSASCVRSSSLRGLKNSCRSLRSERFSLCGFGEKNEELGSKTARKNGAGKREGSFFNLVAFFSLPEPEIPFLCLSFALKPNGNACYVGYSCRCLVPCALSPVTRVSCSPLCVKRSAWEGGSSPCRLSVSWRPRQCD